MAEMIKTNTEQKIASKEISIYQYLILREKDQESLIKSINLLELAASDGLYSNIRRIVTAEEFLDAVGVLSMISKKGSKKYLDAEANVQLKEKYQRN